MNKVGMYCIHCHQMVPAIIEEICSCGKIFVTKMNTKEPDNFFSKNWIHKIEDGKSYIKFGD